MLNTMLSVLSRVGKQCFMFSCCLTVVILLTTACFAEEVVHHHNAKDIKAVAIKNIVKTEEGRCSLGDARDLLSSNKKTILLEKQCAKKKRSKKLKKIARYSFIGGAGAGVGLVCVFMIGLGLVIQGIAKGAVAISAGGGR